jgi:general secretion pathway protein B
MSILLDALKKSEQQRQLGKAPNIHSSVESGGSGSGHQWIPMALFTLAAISMAWIGWQQFRMPPQARGTAPPEMAAAAEPASEGSEESQAPPAGVASEPPSDAVDAPASAREPQVAARPEPRTPVESFRPDARPPQDAGTAPPPDSQVTRGQPAPAVIPGPSGPAAKQTAAASGPGQEPQPAAAPADAPAQPASTRAAAHVSEPINYWSLPQGVRDSLPDMHITVLVYAEQPESRFVLMNGKRVIEQEVYEPGVVLEEIRRDGAVFRYRTYRFLVEG